MEPTLDLVLALGTDSDRAVAAPSDVVEQLGTMSDRDLEKITNISRYLLRRAREKAGISAWRPMLPSAPIPTPPRVSHYQRLVEEFPHMRA